MKSEYTRKLRIVEAGIKYIIQRRVLFFWWVTAVYEKQNPAYFDTIKDAEKSAGRFYSKRVAKVLY